MHVKCADPGCEALVISTTNYSKPSELHIITLQCCILVCTPLFSPAYISFWPTVCQFLSMWPCPQLLPDNTPMWHFAYVTFGSYATPDSGASTLSYLDYRLGKMTVPSLSSSDRNFMPKWMPGLNYANPVYGVAIICHQVRWLRWGHPSLFHTATSLWIWYAMFWVRDISYGLIWMEFINMFSVYAQSGTHSRFDW